MTCPKCHQTHDPTKCQGHVIKDPDTRAPIPPRQCEKTPVKGSTVCRSHGAAKGTPAAAAAERRVVNGKAEALLAKAIWNPGAEPVTDSVGEMQRLAGALRQAVDVLGGQLHVGDACEACGRAPVDLDSAHALAWVRVLRELRTLLGEMERLGIASRGMELAEQYGAEIASVVRAILSRLALSEEQQQLVVVVVPEELRRAAVELEGATT